MDGQTLKQHRLALNLTQTQLAEELGVTVTAVAMWERGERQPATPKMLSLAMRQIEMEHLAPNDLLRRARELAERIEANHGDARQRVRSSAPEPKMTAKQIAEEQLRRWQGK